MVALAQAPEAVQEEDREESEVKGIIDIMELPEKLKE